VSGAGWERSDASAADVAARLLGRLDKTGAGLGQARAVTAWRDAAGPEVASHARGFALRGGELLVFVDSSVWANELCVLAEHYRSAVNQRLGKEAVSSIRFAVSRKVSEARAWDAVDAAVGAGSGPAKTTPVPASETEVAQIKQMASAVRNKNVREAVVAAAIRNLEWRKGLDALNAPQRGAQGATEAEQDAGQGDS
jgi:hypothetical protein